LLLRILSPAQAVGSINLNVMLLYVGMLFVSEVFLFSKVPDYLATMIVSKTKTGAMSMLAICAFAGLLSVFLENVAVVLLVAPVAISIAKKCDIDIVPLFVGLAVSANLQGSATLIGDPPSMLLAGYAKMNFNDFFLLDGRPGLFFAVQLAAIASLFVLYYFFRKFSKRTPELQREGYVSLVPSALVVLMIISLAVGSSLEIGVSYTNGFICLVFGIICFAWYIAHTKARDVKNFVFDLDWHTAVFLVGVFILVEGLSANGVPAYLAKLILDFGGGSKFVLFMLVVWISVVLSAFIDNVPFLLAMLPVTAAITQNIGASPHLFYFGLLLGASVGGNVTPIGASANIVAMGIVKKQGCEPKFMDFVKIGLPFTIVSVLVGSMFLWIMFS
jgi:Na+/H+ antiporter NhaD/arsenite permease-like protein